MQVHSRLTFVSRMADVISGWAEVSSTNTSPLMPPNTTVPSSSITGDEKSQLPAMHTGVFQRRVGTFQNHVVASFGERAGVWGGRMMCERSRETDAQTHTQTQTHTHTHTHAHTHTHKNKHTHTHTNKHTHKQKQTHTHAKAHPLETTRAFGRWHQSR